MAVDLAFRRNAVKTLTTAVGVYVLCDLDKVPVYVGKSTDGIRKRVQRHLTSARSDVIANRQIDVWEIAFVWEYPMEGDAQMSALEAALFHHFHPRSRLMNGTVPSKPPPKFTIPKPAKIVQVMSNEEIAEKQDLEQRLPRQAAHYAQIVAHFLVVKKSKQIAQAMDAHFERLAKYHKLMAGLDTDED